jgi:tetratricopeptide (TPR) repeat protein
MANLEEALQIYEDLGIKFGITQTICFISYLRFNLGQYEQGKEDAVKALALAHELESLRGVLLSLTLLGIYSIVKENYDRAGKYLDEALSYYKEHGPAEQEELPLLAAQVIYLCRTDRALQARQPLISVLSFYVSSKNSLILSYILPAIALYELIQGKVERAVELYALFGKCWPGIASTSYIDDLAGKQIKAAAASESPEMVADTEARGRELDPWETAQELLAELESQIQGEVTDV